MIRRWLPVVLIVAVAITVYLTGVHNYLSFDALKDHRETLLDFASSNPLLAPLTFVLIYAASTAMSLPGAAILTIAGGFIFGLVLGSVLAVIGATIGATLIFLIAKTSFGEVLRKKAGGWMKRMEDGFQEDAFSYLLILRLVPLFPFWLVNLVPAFLGVGLLTFVSATFLGIIPGTAVYVSVGNGLGSVFDRGETPDLGLIFEPQILLPILGLAVLACVPVVYKRFRGKNAPPVPEGDG
ncbi:MAG: TVP38/TMEM64 family protein [Geminicoccaceae bacterium]